MFVGDVRMIEGIWAFDVRANAGRHLKNPDSVRLVPVHNTLPRLGLIQSLIHGRRADERLFADLTKRGADGKLGLGFTKWFSRYRRQTGLYQPRRDFHSLSIP